MQPPLKAWYTLREVRGDDAELYVRLLPDFFEPAVAEPVLTLIVCKPDNALESIAGLERFKTETVNDVVISERSIELWAEYDDAPTTISGQSARWAMAARTPEELVEIIAGLREELDSWQRDAISLRAHLKSVEDYSADLLHRAQAKKSMTNKTTATMDARIEVLERVLAKLRDA